MSTEFPFTELPAGSPAPGSISALPAGASAPGGIPAVTGGLGQFTQVPGFGDLSGLPDEDLLQELANQFFKAPPVPQATHSAIGTVPASVAGSGISPSAVNQGNAVDLNDPQTSLPDPHFAGTGHVPSSVAGSGASPSAASYKGPQHNGRGPAGTSGNAGPANANARPSNGNIHPTGAIPGPAAFSYDPAFYFLGEGHPFHGRQQQPAYPSDHWRPSDLGAGPATACPTSTTKFRTPRR